MDRIDVMTAFVAAFLEGHMGVQLLHRTTRSSRLSEVGERYAVACR